MQSTNKAIWFSVTIAALGYFVDIYDLLLFSIVRVPSLRSLGLDDASITTVGLSLLNWQMTGMLVGGIIWGVLGDKKGRLSVLFGSIFLYSVANILNGMVTSVEQYKILRFIAGIGLAGELGAGITLVSEVMSKEKRGYGTTIVAAVGLWGAVVAYFVSKTWDWRTAYYIGGGLGLLLLVLRISVFESGMFNAVKAKEVKRGSFPSLFSRGHLTWKYLRCIGIGIPLWFVVGILVSFSPEFAKVFGMTEPVEAGRAVMWCYTGLALGDLSSGLLSQWLRSRKMSLYIFQVCSVLSVAWYLLSGNISADLLYFKIFLLGFFVGYWAVFVTVASEQFGTNIRATVTTTVPNFVRGSLVPITWFFTSLLEPMGRVGASFVVFGTCAALAFLSLATMQETFGKDLDYVEKL